MSRCVRDLRHLICQSRLTRVSVGSSNSQESSNDDECLSNGDTSNVSGESEHACSVISGKQLQASCDSGVGSRPSTADASLNSHIVFRESNMTVPHIKRKRRRRRDYSRVISSLDKADQEMVSDWLTQANQLLSDVVFWCENGERFVKFAQFWLHEFPEVQRNKIFRLEAEILSENLHFCIRESVDSSDEIVLDLINLVLPELEHLFQQDGATVFLDHLFVFAYGPSEHLNELLSSAVRPENKNLQTLLALRAFALLSLWTAIINFHKQVNDEDMVEVSSSAHTIDLVQDKGTNHNNFVKNCKIKKNTARPSTARPDTSLGKINGCEEDYYGSIYARLAFHAVKLDALEFLDYLFDHTPLGLHARDSQKRTLIFAAALHGRDRILQSILLRNNCNSAINQHADNGNTPLHVAASRGDPSILRILLSSPHVKINCSNKHCDDATPLHLAVLHASPEMVQILLEAGADRRARMDGKTAAQLASELGLDRLNGLL